MNNSTTPLNPNQSSNSNSSKKENIARAAAIGGSAVAGAAAGWAANSVLSGNDTPDEEIEQTIDVTDTADDFEMAATGSDYSTESYTEPEPVVVPQPTPQVNTSNTTTSSSNSTQSTTTNTANNNQEVVVEDEEEVEVPETPTEETNNEETETTPTETVTTEETTETVNVEDVTINEEEIIEGVNVNPDDIAEAVIAQDEIDVNDIESNDIINFEEIGTVYTVDGEAYTAAAFQSPDGEELLMVDVDADDIFDIITTTDGEYVGSAGGLTVGDAELQISANDPTYLASSDTDLPVDDSYLDDIITV